MRSLANVTAPFHIQATQDNGKGIEMACDSRRSLQGETEVAAISGIAQQVPLLAAGVFLADGRENTAGDLRGQFNLARLLA